LKRQRLETMTDDLHGRATPPRRRYLGEQDERYGATDAPPGGSPVGSAECPSGEPSPMCNRWQASTGEWCRLAPDDIVALRALNATKT